MLEECPDAYVLAGTEHDKELARIRAIEADLDPKTARHLTDLGVGPGWRCLEGGGGGGGVARWLAERVGPTGRVVATDINTRFLDMVSLPNVEVRRHNILTDELEEGAFDVAHCRTLLIHMREPERVIERLVHALRPGGVLLVEEPAGLIGRADPTWPLAAEYELALAKQIAALKAIGVDMNIGVRLPGMLLRVGLTDVGGEATSIFLKGGPSARRELKAGTAIALRAALVAAGAVTDAEIDAYLGIIDDPGLLCIEPPVMSAWGRRPL